MDIVNCFVSTYWSHLGLFGVVKFDPLPAFFIAVPTGEAASEKFAVVPPAVIVSALVVESGVTLLANDEKCHTPM